MLIIALSAELLSFLLSSPWVWCDQISSSVAEPVRISFQGPPRPVKAPCCLNTRQERACHRSFGQSGFPNSTDYQELRGKPLIDKFPCSCFEKWPSSEMVHTWFSEQSPNGCMYYLDFLECLNTQNFVPPSTLLAWIKECYRTIQFTVASGQGDFTLRYERYQCCLLEAQFAMVRNPHSWTAPSLFFICVSIKDPRAWVPMFGCSPKHVGNLLISLGACTSAHHRLSICLSIHLCTYLV